MSNAENVLVGGWKTCGMEMWKLGQALEQLSGYGPADVTSRYSSTALCNLNEPNSTKQFGATGIGTELAGCWLGKCCGNRSPSTRLPVREAL
jgi:hypothetical protein